jgi:hypothetical protein
MGLRTYVISAVFCAFVAPTSLAAPKLKIAPVELTGYVGKNLKVAFALPCGADFHGIVTSTNKKKLKVGVAYLMGNIRCASVPEQEELVIDFLDTTGFKEISPLKIKQTRMKIVSDRMIDARVLKETRAGTQIQIAYEPSCGTIVGTLVQQTDQNTLKLSQLEKMSVRQSISSCPRAQHTRIVTSLRLGPERSLGVIGPKTKTMERAYTLKLAPIKKGSLHRLKKRGLALKYQRQCNEAPVGVVLKSNGKKKSSISMLVAKYVNKKCSEDQVWTSYINADIYLPKGRGLVAIKTKNLPQFLRISAPTSFSRRTKNRKVQTGVAIDYLGTCDQVIGAVYARNTHVYGVHIGLLVAQSYKSCKKSFAEVSLFEPFLSKRVRLGSLRPLRIKGNNSH